MQKPSSKCWVDEIDLKMVGHNCETMCTFFKSGMEWFWVYGGGFILKLVQKSLKTDDMACLFFLSIYLFIYLFIYLTLLDSIMIIIIIIMNFFQALLHHILQIYNHFYGIFVFGLKRVYVCV